MQNLTVSSGFERETLVTACFPLAKMADRSLLEYGRVISGVAVVCGEGGKGAIWWWLLQLAIDWLDPRDCIIGEPVPWKPVQRTHSPSV